MSSSAVPPHTQTCMPEDATAFLNRLEKGFSQSNQAFARAYYLFATARLSETYQSSAIYKQYPELSKAETFQQLKTLYDASRENPPTHSHKETDIGRLFSEVMGTTISARLATQSDALQNRKSQLQIDLTGLGLLNSAGFALDSVLYEDAPELFKKISAKTTREALHKRVSDAYTAELTPLFVELFEAENRLMSELGYPDIIAFYSQTSGHNLLQLGEQAKQLVEETECQYQTQMGQLYQAVTGLDFKHHATRADISYVLYGATQKNTTVEQHFAQENMLPLAIKTFDGLGLQFSSIAETVSFETMEAFENGVVKPGNISQIKHPKRILLDIANREGKRSRAYVYPARIPSEIYLSVKPEGGIDDYSAFFHESGHALHFAYTNPELPFSCALMGNNTTTETYAYLMQNLLMNPNWLVEMAGLSGQEASHCVKQRALTDLYMMRRYASKMQFELALYHGVNQPEYTLTNKGEIYARYMTQGCGFVYHPQEWTRDVDAGFYVADYFTAWTLEAQMREYLSKHYGDSGVLHGANWYQNPDAGNFLKQLWQEGNISQQLLSEKLGYHNPVDVKPLLRLMHQCLNLL
jgi:ABC-type transporter Mla MlaB component